MHKIPDLVEYYLALEGIEIGFHSRKSGSCHSQFNAKQCWFRKTSVETHKSDPDIMVAGL